MACSFTWYREGGWCRGEGRETESWLVPSSKECRKFTFTFLWLLVKHAPPFAGAGVHAHARAPAMMPCAHPSAPPVRRSLDGLRCMPISEPAAPPHDEAEGEGEARHERTPTQLHEQGLALEGCDEATRHASRVERGRVRPRPTKDEADDARTRR